MSLLLAGSEFRQIMERLDKMEAKNDQAHAAIGERIGQVENRIKQVENRIGNLENTVQNFQSNLESMVTEILDQLKPEI